MLVATAAAATGQTLPGGDIPHVAPRAAGPQIATPPTDPAQWDHWGRVPPVGLPGGGVRLAHNTSLVFGPVWIAARAQSLSLTVSATPGMATVAVVAHREADGVEVPLGVIEPTATRQEYTVGLAPVAGQAVRVTIEPTPVLGGGVDVHAVGLPVTPLAGWRVDEGAPRIVSAPGGAALDAGDTRLRALSPRVRVPADVVALSVEARGHGRLRLSVGTQRTSKALDRGWSTLQIGLRGGGAQRLQVDAQPEGVGPIHLRRVGRYIYRVRGVGLARQGQRITGRLVPRGGNLALRVRTASGGLVASGRSDRAGRVALVARPGVARGVPLVLEVVADPTRRGARLDVRGEAGRPG